MPFIPHTQEDIDEMLKTIGVNSIEQLFDEIPDKLKTDKFDSLPDGVSEMEIVRIMKERAHQNKCKLNFVGAGAYEHHIPAPVWNIAARGEFMTAYTPYQAEASQGGLQVMYEYQTMMAGLTGMDASNASMYDGGSGLAEAILMSIRCIKKNKSRRVLIPKSVNPFYRDCVKTIATPQNIELIEIDYDSKTGKINQNSLSKAIEGGFATIVIAQPNFFGMLEDIDYITNLAHQNNAIVIALVNPLSLSILREPGHWGTNGADIVCGEGQPFGTPLSFGGPYFGFMACKNEYVRQMPGRIVGLTDDVCGNKGYILTLQAREQHIRRSKATSNICSNEGLMVTAATIYMSLLGPEGISNVAKVSHENTLSLIDKLKTIKGIEIIFDGALFHEVVVRLPISASTVINKMADEGILAGFDMSEFYPELGNALLVCCTETKSLSDIERFVSTLKNVL